MVAKLLRTAQKYKLTLQPQLILLQKTLLNTEGLARTLDPEIDLWAVARPVLEAILRERYSPKAFVDRLQKQWPEIVHQASGLPALLQSALAQQVEGETSIRMRSDEIAQLVKISQRNQRQLFTLAVAVSAGFAAGLLYFFVGSGPMLYAAIALSLAGFTLSWPRTP